MVKVNHTKAETFFNNIVTNRHQVAHEGYSNIARALNQEFDKPDKVICIGVY
jgi:hypothetical protein